MDLRRLLWLLLSVLVLTGCEQVRFAALPGGPHQACEPAWVGDWYLEDIGPEADSSGDRSVLRVEPGCTAFHLLEWKDGAWVREDHLPNDDYQPRYSRTGKHRLLGLMPVAAESTPEAPKVLVVVWRPVGDTIELALPDVQRSAELLVRSSDYAGAVTRTREESRHVLNVQFTGDPDALASLLDREDLLEAPGLRLRRMPAQDQQTLQADLRAAIDAAEQAARAD